MHGTGVYSVWVCPKGPALKRFSYRKNKKIISLLCLNVGTLEWDCEGKTSNLSNEADGSIERHKTRLVAKGFDQRCGIDYTETFSPVTKPATVRLVLAIAVHFNWPICQLDISDAFLHGNLPEDVYMAQPQGFVISEFPNYVCKLNNIYGLKQAPRAWCNLLSESLLDFGFFQSMVDA
jgi:hypothetical protein